ncbi:ribosome biogenesis GTPase YqeH [Longirhabdus pacifica]|uniref:ribosome biogenesis GTPase YqeH n=1 Tax=Longirhabdus pacifica TaxID=2305227 RepID=UPI001F0CA6F1|nr:ribosome biogenesis GTPase YqeH [Longirhabdus pacifica]
MSEMMSDTEHCSGCGIKLQNEQKHELGYIPEEALTRERLICQRCFRIKHYNDASTSYTLDENEFLRILHHVGETDCVIVNIVDIFDIEGSMIRGLSRFIQDQPLIFVVNKFDLLPQSTNPNKIINWIQQLAKEYGLKPEKIELISAKRDSGLENVVHTLESIRNGRDVYVIGATNVGKSTFINGLIRNFSDLDEQLTTSQYPGTTLNKVEIPMDDGSVIVDTPGIVYGDRLTEMIQNKYVQKILPQKMLKPPIYQLNSEQTLFLGSLARFDFKEGERQSFTFYVSNAINIHRTKLENADELYDNHKGKMLTPPSKDDLASLPALVKHEFRIKAGMKQDVVISGLGWIKANGSTGATVNIHAPKGVHVILRNSLI